MNPTPTVSIIICTRNRAKTLLGTLHSLTMLKTEHSWEALVVDNASVDDTIQVINSADDCGGRLHCMRVDQIGLGAARDAAWRRARGQIVSFTDDDCYLQADYVDAIVEVFRAYPEIGCVGGRIMLFDPLDARVTIDERDRSHQIPPFQFIDAGEVQGANLSFRRAVLDQIGGFDLQLGAGTRFPCEDIDAAAAVVWLGHPVRYDPQPVVFHHHRRRSPEAVKQLEHSYDFGRGAYYAKYILRRDTRAHYITGWWTKAKSGRSLSSFARLSREILAAFMFFVSCRRYGFLVMAMPVLLAGYGVVGLRVALVGTCRRLITRRKRA